MKTVKLYASFDRLNANVGMFQMRSIPAKYKIMLKDQSAPKPNLVFEGELDEVDQFCFFEHLRLIR